MTRTTLRTILLLALALAAPAALAQGKPAAAPGAGAQVGLGVEVTGFTAASLLDTSAIAPVMIHVPINLAQSPLRLEPSIGVFTFDPDGGTSESVVSLGVGVYYLLKPSHEFSYYAGPRLTLGFVGEKNNATGESSSGTDVDLAAAVGGEWWANPSFALGAEVRLGFVSVASLTGFRAGATSFQTGGSLFARFYF